MWPGWNYNIRESLVKERQQYLVRAPYHDLLSLGKVVARVAVESHLAQLGDWHVFLGDDLGGIKQIEAKLQLVFLIHDLNTELQN